MVSNLRGRGRNKTRESCDQFSSFIEVTFLILCQAALDGGGAHEVNRRSIDDLDGWHFGDVSSLILQNSSFSFPYPLLGYPRL